MDPSTLCLIAIVIVVGLFLGMLVYMVLQTLVTFFFVSIDLKLQKLAANTPHKESLQKISKWQFLKAMIKETYCNAKQTFSRPLTIFTFKPDLKNCDLTQTPVILVHGFLRSHTDWLWFLRRLRKEYSGPVYAALIRPKLAPIQQLASCLHKQVLKVMEETGQKQVILVGHSMGGVISSYYAENTAESSVVKKVITLGSPLQGTRMAVLAIGDNVRQLVPQSGLLNALSEKITNSSRKYYHLAVILDNMIIPWQSALFSNTEKNQVIFPEETHLSLMFSKPVLDQVCSWINEPC